MPRRQFDSEKHDRNAHGRLVSKKKRAVGLANRWASAVKAARDKLGIKGFVPIKKGTKLYDEAKSIYLLS